MFNTKNTIILLAMVYLVGANFEICFDLVATDLNNLYQAECRTASTGGDDPNGKQLFLVTITHKMNQEEQMFVQMEKDQLLQPLTHQLVKPILIGLILELEQILKI